MEKDIVVRLHKNFEESAHHQDGVEFWYARELQTLLEYDEWRNFEKIVNRAKIACESAGQAATDHFVGANKMIDLGKGATRKIADIMLTRYACYLIAQNGDPRKEAIAFAMTYFAVQTRKQEVIEQRLAEWERLQIREKLTLSERSLSSILFERGIDAQGFARIRSQGDKALFGGYNTADMKRKLAVPDKRPLVDFLPAVTIKAKELVAEITNHNVRQNKSLSGEPILTGEHVKNNQNMRDMLVKSGIYPESLPAHEDVKKVAKRAATENKKLPKSTNKLKKLL